MKYISMFSGIEAATVAWEPLGWKPIAFAEIEKFPSAVLSARWPNVTNMGDVTKVDWGVWHGKADVVIGGSPCQSFSIAGLRKGLDDPRGNLALEYLRAIDRIRPAFFIWENVPGVLSSNGGKDFGTFLGAVGELGYGWAYRVLDAQYFGVAQRRRRVFLVGSLGDWRPAGAVLFEPACLRGDSPPSRETREGTAPTLAARTKGGGGLGTDAECSGALIPEVAGCLQERDTKGADSDTKPGHLIPVSSFAWQYGYGINNTSGEIAMTLVKNQTVAVKTTHAVRRLTPIECERLQGFPDDYTRIPYRRNSADKCPDGPRYKALGNSMAVPVIRWIGERIKAFKEINP